MDDTAGCRAHQRFQNPISTRPPDGSNLLDVSPLPHLKPPAKLDAPPGGTDDAPGAPFSRPEVRIVCGYMLLASTWIVGSDMLLNRMARDDSMTVFLHSFKGLNFVVTTGALLYLTLRRSFGGWRRSEKKRMAEITASSELFRNLSARIQTLREEERTRISREIHDELGQHLTGLKLKLRLIESQLERHNDRALNCAIDGLVEATTLVDETIDSVRRISTGLRPAALDHLGLASAIEEETAQFTRRTGIQCLLRVTGMDAPLPTGVETAAFRIFQESLTNVARHAKATKVEADCHTEGGFLVVRVRDDGVGIDPAVAENPGSLGLVGMLERASSVGGRLEFRARNGHGTEILLRVPLEESPTQAPLALSL